MEIVYKSHMIPGSEIDVVGTGLFYKLVALVARTNFISVLEEPSVLFYAV